RLGAGGAYRRPRGQPDQRRRGCRRPRPGGTRTYAGRRPHPVRRPVRRHPGSHQMIDQRTTDRIVAAALDEDARWGDLTSENLVPESALVRAHLVAREPGVFSGTCLLEAAFRLVDPEIRIELQITDGEVFEPKSLGTITGSAR